MRGKVPRFTLETQYPRWMRESDSGEWVRHSDIAHVFVGGPKPTAIKYFANLTNGIEVADQHNISGFVRIQSSLLERQCWDMVLSDLDYTFLLNLALGFRVVVFDASQRKPESRAIYQGLPWIRYALNRAWYDMEEMPIVKRCNCTGFFSKCYNKLSMKTRKKLNYVGKFSTCGPVKLFGVSYNTKMDGNYDYYKAKLIQCGTGKENGNVG